MSLICKTYMNYLKEINFYREYFCKIRFFRFILVDVNFDVWDDTHMTSKKIVQFQDHPCPATSKILSPL